MEACEKRREHLTDSLKEKFVESPGKVASPTDVTENKNIVTRAVKETFDSVVNDRKKGQYKNMRCSISFESSSDSSSFEHSKDSVIHGSQQELIVHKEKAISLMDAIKSSVKVPLTSSLISLYNKEMEHVFALTENIDRLYEKEFSL